MTGEYKGSEDLSIEGASRYISLAARADYLVLGRPVVQFACKALSARTSTPRKPGWDKFLRLGRYLRSEPRVVHRYRLTHGSNMGTVYTDANWVGDRKARRNTSGECVMIGSRWVTAWNKPQS